MHVRYLCDPMKLIERFKSIYGVLTFPERTVVALISAVLLVLHLNYTPWLSKGKIFSVSSVDGVLPQSARIFLIHYPGKPGGYSATELVITFVVFFGLWVVLALII